MLSVSVKFFIDNALLLFFEKKNDINSFKMMEYIRYKYKFNAVYKNEKDKYVNIFTSTKLIVKNYTMSINNVIKFK